MKNFLPLLIIVIFLNARAQQKPSNPQGLKIDGFAAYMDSCKANTDNKLLEIKKFVPGVVLDIKYATTDNFMKRVMYKQARAFARKPLVMQLKKIQAALKPKGYGLKIFDAYRPYSVTLAFYEGASDKAFVANPAKGSKHNRGCAVDLTIIDLKTGLEIAMPTPYDSFAREAASEYAQLPAAVLENRKMLIDIMHKHGFRVIPNE